jgi:hypothetical protein
MSIPVHGERVLPARMVNSMADLKEKRSVPPARAMLPPLYMRKQTGNVMTIVVLVGLACIIYLMSQKGVQRVLVFYIVILAFLALMFSSMTVTVTAGVLTIKFGLGVIRKRFNLSDIVSCEVVSNPWYYGWGIRRIPGGWFFGVAGQKAVELTMKSGKRFRIGTADPEELKAALEEFADK